MDESRDTVQPFWMTGYFVESFGTAFWSQVAGASQFPLATGRKNVNAWVVAAIDSARALVRRHLVVVFMALE